MKNKRKKKERASLTVEAAFVFPIFFFAVLVFLSFFQLMLIQAEVQRAIFDTASFSSQYVYFSEKFLKNRENKESMESSQSMQKESYGYQGTLLEFSEGLLNKALVKAKFLSFVDKRFLNHSCIKNGVAKISFSSSKFLENGNDIDIIAIYKVKLPNPFIKLSYTIIQQVKTKAFLGKSMVNLKETDSDIKDLDTKIVYIAETGKVYHISRSCTYLNPSIKQTSFKSLEIIRNEGGHKYYRCSSCCKKGEIYEKVYITTWGEGYHSQLDCSGLKRTIREEKLTKAQEQGYYACSKCGLEED